MGVGGHWLRGFRGVGVLRVLVILVLGVVIGWRRVGGLDIGWLGTALDRVGRLV